MTNQQPGRGTGPAGPDPDAIREEAERLVATGLAAVSMVADRIGAPTRERGGSVAAGYDALGDMLFGPAGHRRHNVANDSAECCRCPVCRVISAARTPNPDVAERLATGVGTVAEGAARVLRGVAGAAGSFRESRPGPRTGGVPAPGGRPEPAGQRWQQPDPWAAATATPAGGTPGAAAPVAQPTTPESPAPESPVAESPAPESPAPESPVADRPPAKPVMAKKAVKKSAKAAEPAAKQAVAKQAVAKKAVKKAVRKQPGAEQPATGPVAPKQAVAKKAVKKAAGGPETPGGADR